MARPGVKSGSVGVRKSLNRLNCAAKGRPPTGHGVYFFPPGAPLRRGGVYPLKAGGGERCAVLYGAERRGAPEGTRTSSLHPTYLR